MKETVTIQIDFSFRGERHSPSLKLDLDELLKSNNVFPSLYPLLARANNYDVYSYEYEMMQAEPIRFLDAEGLIAEFINDGTLDEEAYLQNRGKQKTYNALKVIAKENMQIDDLSQQPDLEKALFAAYQLGKK